MHYVVPKAAIMNGNLKTNLSLIIFALAILFIILFVNLPGNSIFMDEVQNTGHSIAFGAFSIIILVIVQKSKLNAKRGQLFPYLFALVLSVVMGGGTEFIQHFIGRDAEVGDIIRDALGSVAFLGLHFSFWRKPDENGRKHLKLYVRVFSAFLSLLLFVPLCLNARAYLERDESFPIICDFGQNWITQFISLRDCKMKIVEAPDNWAGEFPERVAHILLNKAQYPGFAMHEPYPNWSDYSDLNFNIYSDMKDTVFLTLRIDDKHHNNNYNDRYNRTFPVAPGANSYRFSLTDVKFAPATRETDMKSIGAFVIFGYNIDRDISIYLGKIGLE